MDISRVESLASYVPEQLLRMLLKNPVPTRKPLAQQGPGVVLYAEVAGLNRLVARLTQDDAAVMKKLSQLLNTYFSLFVDFVKAEGGDILSLSGDRALVLWPISNEATAETMAAALTTAARRAVQCALSLQNMLHDYEALDEHHLAIRMSIASGEIVTASVGGSLGRWEFFALGKAVLDAYVLNTTARLGDVLLSSEAYALIQTQCVGDVLPDGNFRVTSVRFPLPSVSSPPPGLIPEVATPLRAYVPGAVLNSITSGQTGWLAELRDVTVLSINVPTITHHAELDQIHQTMRAMQGALYRSAGSVSKLFLSESGIVLSAALGLPPFSYEDYALRGVQAAQLISQELHALALPCNIGVATGKAFCCSIGNARRRDYTLLGNVLRVAEHLMQAVPAEHSPPILCDAATHTATQTQVDFAVEPAAQVTVADVPIPAYHLCDAS